jgi:thiamine-phosphate pyrophosphorylase
VCAIGGITLANVAEPLAAGADLVAVISALYEAADPGLASRKFVELIEQHARNRHDIP